jgi:hypothetical protein
MLAQPIEVKLAPGLLTTLRGPKMWASLATAGVVSTGSTVLLLPMWNGADDAYLINSIDAESVDPALLIDATTGKFIFPLACVNTDVGSNNGSPIELTGFFADKFPSAAPEDLLTAMFTLIVKNGTEQAYSTVKIHARYMQNTCRIHQDTYCIGPPPQFV